MIKEGHNAEKAFSVTTFGFEIKIMDKGCVCGKQPWIRSPCCFCTAYVIHMDCILYALQTEYVWNRHQWRWVFLRSNPVFMPECFPASTCEVLELSAFHLPPFSSAEDQSLNALCLVHVLQVYIDRTSSLRSDQLLHFLGPLNMGNAISKQCLSHWLVEDISLSYVSKGVRPPVGLGTQCTKAIAASV